jgi:hypothetical protein
MAVKYRIQFNSAMYGNAYRIDIDNANYVGAIIELNSGSSPAVLRKDSDGVFSGTSLDITVEVPADSTWGLTDLYSQTSRDNLVKLYKNNVLSWQGYLVAEQYADPLIAPPFDITIRAVDGLGTLKNYTFDMPGTIDNRYSLAAIMAYCLAKLDLPIDIVYSLNIRPQSIGSSPLLTNVYMGLDALRGRTCADVITDILSAFDPACTLTQYGNRWMIYRHLDVAAASYHQFSGTLSETLTVTELGTTTTFLPSLVDLYSEAAYTSGRCFPVDGALGRTYAPAVRKYSMVQNCLLLDDFFRIGIFTPDSFGSDARPYNWTAATDQLLTYGNLSTSSFSLVPDTYTDRRTGEEVTYLKRVYDSLFCRFNKQSSAASQLVTSAAVAVNDNDPAIKITFAARYSRTSTASGSNHVIVNNEFTQGFQVAIKSGLYYINNEGAWTTTAYYFDLSYTGNGTTFTDYSIIVNNVPSGAIQVVFKPTTYTVNGATYTDRQNFDFYNVKAVVVADAQFVTSIEKNIYIDSRALTDTDGTSYGETPEPTNINSAIIWTGIFLVGNTKLSLPAINWAITGDAGTSLLSNCMARSVASNNRAARETVSGVFMGASLNVQSLLRYPNHDNRVYLATTASAYLADDTMEAEFLELLPFAEAEVTVIDSPVYSDATASFTATDANRNYTVFGGSVGVGKRIHQLPTAASVADKWMMIDTSTNESAEKVPYVQPYSAADFANLFELVGDAPNQYLLAKYPFASEGNVFAYTTSGFTPPSLWAGLPIATASVLGAIKIGNYLTIDPDGTLHGQAGGTGVVGSWTELTDKPLWLAPLTQAAFEAAHAHTFSSLTSKPTTLTGYGITDAAPATHTHTFASLTSKPTTISGFGITDAYTKTNMQTSGAAQLHWGNLTSVPSTFAPSAHNHATSEITGLDTALANKEPLITKATGYAKWNGTAWTFANEAYSLTTHNHSGTYEPAFSAGSSAQYRRGDKTWQTLNTAAVTESTNLYYTQARFDIAFAAKSTTNLAEGTSLYFTNARAVAAVSGNATKTAGQFYTGTTAPTNTNRLNFDGYLYATRLYSGAIQVATLSGAETLTNKTLTAPKWASAGYLADANGNEILKFPSTVASAVNEITVSNATTGNAPSFSATGNDVNIGLTLLGKGSGLVAVGNGTKTDEYLAIKTDSKTWWIGVGVNTADDSFVIYDQTRANIGLSINSTTGNVGIGTGTATPYSKLDVNGNITVIGNIKASNGGGDYAKEVEMAYNTSNDWGVITAVHQNTAFKPLQINPYGANVGIGMGTTAPQYQLDVNGTIRGAGIIAKGNETALIVHAPSSQQYSRTAFYNNGGSETGIIHSFDPSWYGGALNASSGAINIDGTLGVTLGAYDNPILIANRSNRNVAIGGAFYPSERLDVNGNTATRGQFRILDASGNIKWRIGFNSSNDDLVFYNAAGAKAASIDQSGNLYQVGNITAYSTR